MASRIFAHPINKCLIFILSDITVSFVTAEPVWHYEPGNHGNRFFGRYVDLISSILNRPYLLVTSS